MLDYLPNLLDRVYYGLWFHRVGGLEVAEFGP